MAAVTNSGSPSATADDLLALSRLALHCGVGVEQVPWDEPAVEWDRFSAVLMRSAWDYHLRLEEFREWVGEMEARAVPLWNPAAVLRWNWDKHYLRELEHAGIPVVPTEWIGQNQDFDLRSLLHEREWTEAVVKPSIAATSYRTERLRLGGNGNSELAAVSRVAVNSDAMVQPFLPQICTEGEWSFVYFAERCGRPFFSHAVIKRPKPGDFRVQTQFGGSVQSTTPRPELLRQVDEVASVISEVAPGPLLYMRLDGVVGEGRHAPAGSFLLMEAELIEPVLFFGHAPHAPQRLAAALKRSMEMLSFPPSRT